MSKKLNERFLAEYAELDEACCEKFGIAENGVEAYMNRLDKIRFAPDRNVVLSTLLKYKNLKGKLANDARAVKKDNEISKNDINWVKKFKKSLNQSKDPISSYLKKAHRYARNQKLKNRIITVVILALVIVAAYFAIKSMS